MGDCLTAYSTGAITFEEREAHAYGETAVVKAKQQKSAPLSCGCPGTQYKAINRDSASGGGSCADVSDQLRQWPVQIKPVPINAPYFDGALVGLARATEGNESLVAGSTDRALSEGLFAVFGELVCADTELSELIKRVGEEKKRLIPNCYNCASPCG